MAGRLYTASWDAATAVTAQIDVFWIAPADDKMVYLEELTIWQTSDFGDAQDEVIGLQIIRGFTSVGSGGSASPLIGKNEPAGAAIGATVRCRDTTPAATGTTDIQHEDGWNVRAPYIWTPPSDDWRPYATQVQTSLVVKLLAAPVDSLTMNASCKLREMG